MKIFLSIICAFFCLTLAEVSLERERRQTGLNGAHIDAMDASKKGGFVGSNNGLKTTNPGDFGARLGGGFGGKVSDNVGVGAAVRGDVGLGNGGPFLRSPEVGVGATYNRGPNTFGLGVGRTFGGSPSNQVGFSYTRTFGKRSADDDGQIYRRKRQAMNTAMTNSLTNKPVGTPQFSYQVDAAGNSGRNFGAAGNAGAGVKVWESGTGRQSVGLGVGAAGNVARVDGKTFTGTPQIGAGVGYQNGRFSATLGAGRPINGPGRNTQYGLNLGYKFKRSASNAFVDGDEEEIPDHHYFDRRRFRRQAPTPALDAALGNSLTNKPIGTPQFSYQVDSAGTNSRDFAGSGSVGSGVKVWESGPHSVGLGVAASGDVERSDGLTQTGSPQVGVGVGYQNGDLSATAGMERVLKAYNQFLLNLSYRFKRETGAEDTAEDRPIDHTAEDVNNEY